MPEQETLPSVPQEAPPELRLDETALPDRSPLAATGIHTVLPERCYEGISCVPMSPEEAKDLAQDAPDDDIDIRPDGLIYASHVYYRQTLSQVIGVGQWALRPMCDIVRQGNVLYQRWALYIRGAFVAEALAAHPYYEDNRQMDYSDVVESIKSDALRRCCKDLCMALNCWNRRFGEQWKRKYAVQVLCATRQGNQKLWRRKDADPLGGEIPPKAEPTEVERDKGSGDKAPLVTEPAASRQSAAPPPPSTPPPSAPIRAVPKSAPTPVVKPGPPASAPAPAKVELTTGQMSLLWARATKAGLVIGQNASEWINFMAQNCMIPIPERPGKTSKETADYMMKQLPAGQQFQRLLKTLEIMAQQKQVEI